MVKAKVEEDEEMKEEIIPVVQQQVKEARPVKRESESVEESFSKLNVDNGVKSIFEFDQMVQQYLGDTSTVPQPTAHKSQTVIDKQNKDKGHEVVYDKV